MVKVVASKIPNKKFWDKRKVFITGHTSFKGTWLKLWLEHLGSRVYGLSKNYPSFPNNLYQKIYKKNNEVGSILNYKELQKKISKSNSDIAFHFAAQSIVSEASKMPIDTYKTNILGTATFLESCLKAKKVKLAVIITTDKCYDDNFGKNYFKEESILGGSEPYSASKACAEILSKSYVNKFKKKQKKIITLRAGNVLGGGDWKKNRIVPDILKAVNKNLKIKIRNPNSTRPWQHVLDCLNGYILASEYSFNNKFFYNTWNISSSLKYQISVKKLLEIFSKKLPKLKKLIHYENNKSFYETKTLHLNSYKAEKELGWKAILNNENIVDFILEWHQANNQKKNMKSFSINQILKFYKKVTYKKI